MAWGSPESLGTGMGSDCGPCRASGSAGGGAGETQGGGGWGAGADNGEETLEDKD